MDIELFCSYANVLNMLSWLLFPKFKNCRNDLALFLNWCNSLLNRPMAEKFSYMLKKFIGHLYIYIMLKYGNCIVMNVVMLLNSVQQATFYLILYRFLQHTCTYKMQILAHIICTKKPISFAFHTFSSWSIGRQTFIIYAFTMLCFIRSLLHPVQ